jgi:hypothetical protein
LQLCLFEWHAATPMLLLLPPLMALCALAAEALAAMQWGH